MDFWAAEVNSLAVFNTDLDYKIKDYKMKIFLIAITFFYCSTVSNAQVLISLIFGDELNYRQY